MGFGLFAMVLALGSVSQSAPPSEPPDVSSAIAAGNVAKCENGTFSDNTDFDATCSSNGGVAEWLAPFGQCEDGTVIAMSADADCGDHDGFEALLPVDYVPVPGPDDVARCGNGTFSDNTKFDDTCSSNGEVDLWLAPYGVCQDGHQVQMSTETDCGGDHDGFAHLLFVEVAQCVDGTTSTFLDFAQTCAQQGGVANWLAPYGTCFDGTVIEISAAASCVDHGGFERLMPAEFDPSVTTTSTTTTSLAPPSTATSSGPVSTAPAPTTVPTPEDAIRREAEDLVNTGEVLDVATDGATIVITIRAEESVTEGLTKDNGREAVFDALRAVRQVGFPAGVDSVRVIIRYFPLVNQYGEESEETVIHAEYSRAVVERLVFENLDPRQILTLADISLIVHPAFAKGDGS